MTAALLSDASFEQAGVDAADNELGSFVATPSAALTFPSGSARTGTYALRLAGNGTDNIPKVLDRYIPVAPGRTVEIEGAVRKGGASATDGKAELRLLTYTDIGVGEAVALTIAPTGLTTSWPTAPLNIDRTDTRYVVADGINYVRLEYRINMSPPASTDLYDWDDVQVYLLSDAMESAHYDGAVVVYNASGQPIVDGTRDMFRIVATGTLAFTAGPNGSVGSPAQITMTSSSHSIDDTAGYPLLVAVGQAAFANPGSQPSPTPLFEFDASGNALNYLFATVRHPTTDTFDIQATWKSWENATAQTATVRYYLLEQTGGEI